MIKEMIFLFIIITGSLIIGYLLRGGINDRVLTNDLPFTILEKLKENNEYDRDNYNCVNFSKDATFILNKLGYNSRMVRGCEEDNCHRWISLDIEPQGGKILYNNSYNEHLEVMINK